MSYHDTPGSKHRHRVLWMLGLIWLFAIVGLAWVLTQEKPQANNGLQSTPGAGQPETDTPDPARSLAGKAMPTATLPSVPEFPPIPLAVNQQVAPSRANQDFDALFSVVVPVHDYLTVAEAFGRAAPGIGARPKPQLPATNRETFYTADGPRQAERIYEDDLADYWVEVGLEVDRESLEAAAERMRARYYPLLRRMFGQERRPGIDGSPRFTVLHVLGASDTFELGYFRDENEYPRSLFPQSNEREMIYLNMAQLVVGEPLYDGTLVHETQHLIQWNLDANEDKWINEGLAQLSETMAGLDTVNPTAYLEQPYIRLDRWNETPPDVYAHYAAAYLYLVYLWEQAGDGAVSELARHPANGLSAIRTVLAGHRPDKTIEEFTGDWAAALFLDGESAQPHLNFDRLRLSPPFFASRVRPLPFEAVREVDQYAAEYIDLDFTGRATLFFAGDTVTTLVDPFPDGESFWYTPPANSSHAQLTAAADLSGLTAAELSFSAWYDLEPGYDFAYLSVSADGGATWELVVPSHPVSGVYGPAWGGQSTGWVKEVINLDAYAGQPILLRFHVITDFEVLGKGFAVGNLAISSLVPQPEWRPDGFVETGATLPQRWEVRLIREGQVPEMVDIPLDRLNRARFDVELGPQGGVLVVMPLTPFVDTTADYWLAVSR